MIITMDGPAGSGKSTLARIVSKKLRIKHFDSGLMYRALAFYLHKKNTNIESYDYTIKRINLQYGKKGAYINGKLINGDVRNPEISQKTSILATNKIARDKVNKVIKNFTVTNDCVVDGRDIGSVVLPNADYKFYITASPEKRASRRLRQLNRNKNNQKTFNEILKEIKERDYRDKNREIAPLIVPENAIIIDTGDKQVPETVNEILNYIKVN